MPSYASSLNNQSNSNINTQQQYMNQDSRFPLPPNIQQQISNKQNLHSMQNFNSFNNNIQQHRNNQQQPFNQQTQNLYQQTSQQNNYLQTSQHNNFQQQPQLNYQIHQHWDQQTLLQEQVVTQILSKKSRSKIFQLMTTIYILI